VGRPGIDDGFQPPKDGSRGGTSEVPDELREASIGSLLDLAEGREKLSVNAGCKRLGEQLGIVPDSLRKLRAAGAHR
jgi:hypothetical protein